MELSDCIRSLECQTVKPDEVVVIGHIDDVDTEKFTNNLVTNLNIKFYKVNGGTCRTRNLGIENVSGDIIIFLDDDILLPKNYVKNVKEIFKDDSINLVTGYIFDAVDLVSQSMARKSDISYILQNQNDEFVQLIREKVFKNSPVTYNPYYILIKTSRNFIKSLFLLEWPIKGKILASGYRSEMPGLEKINGMKKVEWVFGGNFATRKIILNEYKFNENLENHPYVVCEDLEFSARAGKRYDIMISTDMMLLHLRSPTGVKPNTEEKYFSLVINTYEIAKLRGNTIAHRWSLVGLLFSSIIKMPFNSSAIDEIRGIRKGIIALRNEHDQ